MIPPVPDQHSRPHAGLRFLQNSFSWLASNVISRAVAALLFIILTQQVSLAETGAYTLGVTFTALLMPLLGWGLEHLFIRDVSPNPSLIHEYLARYMGFRLLCALLAYLLLLGITQIVGYGDETRTILLVMGVMLFTEGFNELFQAVFVTREEAHTMLYVVGPLNVGRALVGILVLWNGGGALGLTIVLVLTSLLKMIAFGLLLKRRQLFAGVMDTDWSRRIQEILPQASVMFPFVLIDVFWAIEYQSGQVMLSILEGEAAVGLYGAAFAILTLLMLVGQAYMMTIFPVLSRLYVNAQELFGFVYEKSLLYMLIIGLAMAIATTFLGETLLTLIFSNSFAESAKMLVPLVWTLPFFFMHVPVSRVMILENAQNRLALYIGIGALINIVVTVALIQAMGATGVSWARVVSYTLFFCLNYRYVSQHLFRLDLWQVSARVLAIGGAACLIAWLGQTYYPIGSVVLAGLIYIGLLMAGRVISIHDLNRFRRALSLQE